GEIDYRFALSAMRAAGYKGFMAIEGASAGDQFHADQRSLAYAKAVWMELGRARPRAERVGRGAGLAASRPRSRPWTAGARPRHTQTAEEETLRWPSSARSWR